MVILLTIIFILICWIPIISQDVVKLYHPNIVFITIFFIYKITLPIHYLLMGNGLNFTNQFVLFDLILSISLVSAFWVGFGRIKPKAKVLAAVPSDFKKAKVYSFVLIIIGLLLYLIYLKTAYGNLLGVYRLNRYDLFLNSRGLGFLSIGLYILLFGLAIAFNRIIIARYYYKLRSISIWEFLLVLVLIHVILLGDRAPLVFALIPIFVMVLIFKPKLQRKVIVFMPIIVFFLLVFAMIRSLPSQYNKFDYLFVHYNWHNFDPTRFGEFAVQNIVDRDVMSFPDLSFRFGSTYFESIISLVPKALLPWRPEYLSEWYARIFHHDQYIAGGGFGFSLIAECYANFGVIGPAIVGLILGVSFKKLYLYICKYPNIINVSFWGVFLYYIILLPRSGVTPLVKPLLFCAIIPLFMLKLLIPFKKGTIPNNSNIELKSVL